MAARRLAILRAWKASVTPSSSKSSAPKSKSISPSTAASAKLGACSPSDRLRSQSPTSATVQSVTEAGRSAAESAAKGARGECKAHGGATTAAISRGRDAPALGRGDGRQVLRKVRA